MMSTCTFRNCWPYQLTNCKCEIARRHQVDVTTRPRVSCEYVHCRDIVCFGQYDDHRMAGAEYGEGFTTLRKTGEVSKMTVDSLNQQLQLAGPTRLRHQMHPDEAFGLIFDMDDVIVDTRSLKKASWRHVAEEFGLEWPEIERPMMYDMMPEKAIVRVLHWTNDMNNAREIAWSVSQEYAKRLKDVNSLKESGVEKWLALVGEFSIPCALVSSMDRVSLLELLDRLGIRNRFGAIGAADDDMETKAQQYLAAAIKLGRPPEQCVVFVSTPEGITAAHNCTMKAIALLGPCTAPQMKTADLIVGSMMELSVYNIRRLFANKGSTFMDLKKKRIEKGISPPRIRNGTADKE